MMGRPVREGHGFLEVRMWAQAMVEHGLLSGIAAGFAAARYHIDAMLADGATRWLLIGAGVVLAYLLLRRR